MSVALGGSSVGRPLPGEALADPGPVDATPDEDVWGTLSLVQATHAARSRPNGAMRLYAFTASCSLH
jgi:hypothetical protein